MPYGTIGDVFVLDCNGGVHILPGTPAEVNLNIKGARHLLNFAADEIRGRVACVGARVGPAWCVHAAAAGGRSVWRARALRRGAAWRALTDASLSA